MGLFSLDTDRDRALRGYESALGNYTNSVNGLNTNVQNRFSGYNSPYSTKDMYGALNNAYNYAMANVNRNSNSAIANANQGVSERLASQGIGGASGVQQAMYRDNDSAISSQKLNALANLLGQKAGAEQGLMQYGNAQDMQINQLAQAGDQQNIANLLQKYGLMGNAVGMQGANVQNYSNTNWLDDLFAVANTASSFMPLFTKK